MGRNDNPRDGERHLTNYAYLLVTLALYLLVSIMSVQQYAEPATG
jgi:hypothetical protein